MKCIHALLPRLISELGHIFAYHLSVQNTVQWVGWNYIAYLPKKTKVSPLPKGWKAVLANDVLEESKTYLQRLGIFLGNIGPFRTIFKSIESKASEIIFIEHFELQHLASLVVSLVFLKPKFHFWILFRYELEGKSIKAAICRCFLSYMCQKLGKEKVKCLTDSTLLAKSLEKDLQFPFVVIPIPHTEKTLGREKQKISKYQFWWPGGLLREEKGLSKIGLLIHLLKERDDIKVIVAEQARKLFKNSSNLHFVDNFLSRSEYVGWMEAADLILLPYSGRDYSQRTSGIFVEAISLGAIPVTTEGTWMAYELMQFELGELIFKWDESDLLDRLVHLPNNSQVRKKIEKMQSHYQKFHSPEGFISVIQKI